MRKKHFSSVQNLTNKHYSGTQELSDAEDGLKLYSHDIVRKMHKRFTNAQKILDFGAGSGQLAEIWEVKFGIIPDCIEVDPNLISILASKKYRVFSSTRKTTELYSFVYTSNVLEHIENDTQTLRDIRLIMASGGKLAIYVPALPMLFSDLDHRVGHFRRYTKNELISKVESAGFEVEECFWNDSLGILASLSLKLLGYKGKAGLGSAKSLLVYDRIIYPISKILDQLCMRHIIGKNLFLFASIPSSTEDVRS